VTAVIQTAAATSKFFITRYKKEALSAPLFVSFARSREEISSQLRTRSFVFMFEEDKSLVPVLLADSSEPLG
jgi:hypothetical protein